MRRVLALALLVLACGRPPPPEPPKRDAPVAPGAPLQLAVPDEVRVKLDVDLARKVVQAEQQESGKFPPDLESLHLKLHYPKDLRYDPATGQVTSATYPRY